MDSKHHLPHQAAGCHCHRHGFRPEPFVVPCLLLILQEAPAHGYELLEKLTALPYLDAVPDPGVVYRHLRQMEEAGLVESHLEPGQGGPARKVYTMNRSGDEYLANCAARITRRRAALGQFLAAYARVKKEETE